MLGLKLIFRTSEMPSAFVHSHCEFLIRISY